MGTVCRVLLAISLLWNVSALGQQPKPILPDPKVTPGDVFDVTIQDICTPGYSKKVRAVLTHLKKQAYARYGITSWKPGDYEVDHLIPLSLWLLELDPEPLATIDYHLTVELPCKGCGAQTA